MSELVGYWQGALPWGMIKFAPSPQLICHFVARKLDGESRTPLNFKQLSVLKSKSACNMWFKVVTKIFVVWLELMIKFKRDFKQYIMIHLVFRSWFLCIEVNNASGISLQRMMVQISIFGSINHMKRIKSSIPAQLQHFLAHKMLMKILCDRRRYEQETYVKKLFW